SSGEQPGPPTASSRVAGGLRGGPLSPRPSSPGRYWYNFFLGPFPLDPQALLDIKDPGQLRRYYVTVKTDFPLYGIGTGRQDAGLDDADGFIIIRDEARQKKRLLLVRGEMTAAEGGMSGCLV